MSIRRHLSVQMHFLKRRMAGRVKAMGLGSEAAKKQVLCESQQRGVF